MTSTFYMSYAMIWVIVFFQNLLMIGIIRTLMKSDSVAPRGAPLQSGEPAPMFHGVDLSGERFTSDDLIGRVTALVFVSPSCSACSLTLVELNALQYKAQENVIVICHSSAGECAGLSISQESGIRVLPDEDNRIGRLFGISSTPTIALVNESGHIQSYGEPVRSRDLDEILTGATEAE